MNCKITYRNLIAEWVSGYGPNYNWRITLREIPPNLNYGIVVVRPSLTINVSKEKVIQKVVLHYSNYHSLLVSQLKRLIKQKALEIFREL